MIGSFKDQGTQDIFNGVSSKKSRAALPQSLTSVAQRKLSQLEAARALDDLSLPGNHLEALKGDRKGQWSIRINGQYRICFTLQASKFMDVEVVDYH
jgi:proteic killer suppression protein